MAKEEKHTKGKWEIGPRPVFMEFEGEGTELWPINSGKDEVALVATDIEDVDYEANAHRICHCVNNFDELERQRDELVKASKKTIKAWESLEGDAWHPPEVIERWLIYKMKPAIDKARQALSKAQK